MVLSAHSLFEILVDTNCSVFEIWYEQHAIRGQPVLVQSKSVVNTAKIAALQNVEVETTLAVFGVCSESSVLCWMPLVVPESVQVLEAFDISVVLRE